ncbi:MAG: helix-turn-helix transcriptional regulator [Legionella sp.]|nr:helix-turn-helix transcriptional regulator [Legionella sp.]
MQTLGVTFFGYTALDAEGNAYCLGSKADYAEQYLTREHVKKDILIQPQQYKSKYDYDFWDFQALDKKQQELYKMAADFNQSHTLSITQHFNDMSHSFHFSGMRADEGLNQRMLEKMDCLHLFIDLFKEKLSTVKELSEVYDYSTSVEQSTIIDTRPTELVNGNPKRLPLQKKGKKTLNFKASAYLTENERDCLRWLALGKSAQVISKINLVSPKTVERNIASIKEKLGCYTLFQMGIFVAENKLSYFLPKFN